MQEIPVHTRSGGDVHLGTTEIGILGTRLDGTLLVRGSAEYEDARPVWNASIDRRPALIARCASRADVVHCVRLAAERDLLTAIRGGGHNIAGTGTCDGGLVIDLAGLRAVRTDPASRTARVEAGCTLGDFDFAAQQFGLATPLGINSTTGVGGLTLGGGFGWLSRKHGMTIDNLLAATLVTAGGEVVEASDIQNPDLFWALRGGGGNFGVVTSCEFRLHPVGPEVLAGLIVHPLESAGELLRHYREVVAEAPDELAAWLVLRQAPPLPFLPESWHGRGVVVVAVCYVGDAARGERAIEPLRQFGSPIADVVGPQPYTAWQQAFDPLLTPGARNYWKSHDFSELSDQAIDIIAAYAEGIPTPETEIFLAHLGGAVGRVPIEATAYPHRGTRFVLNVHARWREPSADAANIAWARQFFETAAPHAAGGVYVNFMTAEESPRLPAAYGPNYARLAELKRRFDPDNLFRLNQNISPAAMSPVEAR
jgi:FAD/FMN-containing dehydrogenase